MSFHKQRQLIFTWNQPKPLTITGKNDNQKYECHPACSFQAQVRYEIPIMK